MDPQVFAEAVRAIYSRAEVTMLERVRRRLMAGIEEPGWAERKLAEIHYLNREIGNVVGDLQAYEPEVERMIEQAYDQGARRAGEELVKANVLSPDIVPTAVKSSLKMLVRETVSCLAATHTRILRTAEDAYRSVISDAAAQSLAGVYTRRQATQAALDRWADLGVTGFVDSKGRNWGLSEYAEMATRTGIGNAQVAGHLERLSEFGHDLVIIPGHWESCPLCAVWEGKVLSAFGATPGYPTLEEAKAQGLRHPNCAHYPQAYVPGMTREIPQDQKARPDLYKERQAQRYNERQIRRWKRRAAVAGDDRERAKCEAKVQAWQGRQREFVKRTGRRRLYHREQPLTGKESWRQFRDREEARAWGDQIDDDGTHRLVVELLYERRTGKR